MAKNKHDAALIFLFDSKHLPGFKTLVYSLKKTGSFSGLPKICVTNDPAILEDPFVRQECKHIEFLSPEMLEPYQEIKKDSVVEKYKLDWVATYHFLKFNIFRETRYQKLVYLDCDIVALKNIDYMLDDAVGVDFMACRGVNKDRLRRPNSGRFDTPEICQIEVDRYLKNLLSGDAQRKFDIDRVSLSINSGVMVIDRKMLGEETVQWMLERATEKAYKFEQQVVKDFVVERPEIKFQYLSPYSNFGRAALDSTSPEYWESHRDKVGLLHFVGRPPWREDAGGYVDDVWQKLDAERRLTPLERFQTMWRKKADVRRERFWQLVRGV